LEDLMNNYLALGLTVCVVTGTACSRESAPPVHQTTKPETEAVVESRDVALTPELASYIAQVLGELDQIPADRRQRLSELSAFVAQQQRSGTPAKLTFICTHNSRRSHMSQVWAQTAAHYFGVPDVETYSGGTEATAFNPRAVAALRRAGFLIDDPGEGDNPVYQVRYVAEAEPMQCFSKVFDQAPNPSEGFAAVMTCSAADRSCPLVHGSAARIAIPFDDPKAFDGTDQESAKYDERCRQIAREMLYVFSAVGTA
jgi:hypothetical protein